MTTIDQELRRLQPLMERAGQLQAQADTVAEAEARLQAAQAELAAVETLLAAESYAQDLREQLAQLESQRAAVGYDRSSHEEAREALETFQAYEKRQSELDNALQSRPDTEALLEGAQNRKARNEAALQEEVEQIETLEGEIAQLETLLAEYQARDEEVRAQRSAERAAHGRLVTAQQELNALESLRERKTQLEARVEETRYEEGLYKDLVLAFGKNGIPAMIIETAIPELEIGGQRPAQAHERWPHDPGLQHPAREEDRRHGRNAGHSDRR